MERKILVVDDELEVRELLYDSLTKQGYKVVTVTGGKEALELLRTQKPDLILLDIKMPVFDGIETLKIMRDFDNKTKIVMFTGVDTEELERKARLAGASGFLRKSLGMDVLVKSINGIFEVKSKYEDKKILVVDDDPEISSLIKDFLTKEGYNIITASSGEEGLEKFKEERPVLILLDIKLPGMDGIVTLKRIKEIDDKVAVIMITGVGNQEVFEEAKKLGANEYIVKPFTLDYLKTNVLVRMALAYPY